MNPTFILVIDISRRYAIKMQYLPHNTNFAGVKGVTIKNYVDVLILTHQLKLMCNVKFPKALKSSVQP